MNFIKSTIILVGIFFYMGWAVQVTAQQPYAALNDSVKLAVQDAADSMIERYTNMNSFVDNTNKFDMDIKRSYLNLFEERADVLFDFKSSTQTVKIEEYANTISLKMRDISDDIAYFPYKREPVDSIRYDKLDAYYQMPVKLHKVLNYTINPQDSIVKKEKAINLKLFINVYEDGESVKIAGIVPLKTAKIWKDCNGVPSGKAIIGSKCDDCNGKTIYDGMYQFDCSCQCTDCEETKNGEAVIGSSCDDLDEVTTNDTYDKNCNCIGFCSEDEEKKKGDICDDGDETTVNDFYQDDCTCVGSEEDCAGKKGGTALFGSPCDDENDDTKNDQYNKNCKCVGVFIDCEGEENGLAIKGSACDDGDDKTKNDIYQNDCTCKGEWVDCEGEVNGPNLPGTPCSDNNKNTIRDKYQKDCSCIGEAVKKNNYGFYAGPSAILPLAGNVENNAKVESEIGYNLAAGIHFSPANMKKLLFKVGVAYLPYNATLSANSVEYPMPSVKPIFGIPKDSVKININVDKLNESLAFKMLQIPVNISFKLINAKKAGLYLDAFAKPHIVISEAEYNIIITTEIYDVVAGFGSPLILKDYHMNNEIMQNYTEYSDSSFTSKFIQLNKTPLALGGGLSFLLQLGKQNYINACVHYNHYVSVPGWQPVNDSENQNDILDVLINENISDNMINAPLTKYFKEPKSASIELGVHYLIKF